MSRTTGFQGGILGLALAAAGLGLARQAPDPREPAQPAAETTRVAPAPQTVRTAPVKPAPAVAIMDGSVLDVARPAKDESAAVSLFVSNREPTPIQVRFAISLSDSVTGRDTSFALSPAADTLRALEVQSLNLRIPAWNGADGVDKGYLKVIVNDERFAPTMLPRQIRIAPKTRAPWLMNLVLGIGFGLGVAVVVIAWRRRGVPSHIAPLPWSRDSWASNLAVVSSALVVFSGLAAPSVAFHHMTRAQYTSLGALASGVMLLANAFYAFVGAGRDSPPRVPVALGLVLMATVGAAFSQLITLGMLLREALEASVLTCSVYITTSLIVVGTGTGLFIYALRTVSGLSGIPAAAADVLKRRGAAGVERWHLP